MMHRLLPLAIAMAFPRNAWAHASDQGFVLLLPTGVYTVAGVLAVALTVTALGVMPDRLVRAAFASREVRWPALAGARSVTSLAATVLLAWLVWLGLYGPRDPLANLLVLGIWTVGWVMVVTLCGILGNLWGWLNPWTGLGRLLRLRPRANMPDPGLWPATALLVAFSAFLLADVAPSDPARLAIVVGIYWLATFAGFALFGPIWLKRCELGHAILGSYARLAVPGPAGLGLPGWQIATQPKPVGAGALAVALLACGSFDGINETFWWLARIGINPLEFPGRSAVVGQTLTGLLFSVVLLFVIVWAMVWLGTALAGSRLGATHAFADLAPTLLPIAFVYHAAHYLTGFLVSIQYTLAALNDPFDRGSDLLGLGHIHVTTGFFNQMGTVQAIWLVQAGLIVIGHVWSVMLCHRVAMTLYGSERKAALATLPLSVLMIAYTWLGLWLLAAPRGA